MSQLAPGFECPECGAKLFSVRRCPACGWKASEKSEEGQQRSCWTCDHCHAYSPMHPVLYEADALGNPRGLCSRCHFDERIRPYQSRATDLCDAVHGEAVPACQELEHAHRPPHHHIGQHMADVRQLVAKLAARNEEIRL